MRRMIATLEPTLETVSHSPLSSGDILLQNLRLLMGKHNLSQQALADRISIIRGKMVHRERIAQILKGDHSPSLEWIELLARAFGISTRDLLACDLDLNYS